MCLVATQDLEDLGLGGLTFNDISVKSKYQMKKIVKAATKKTAFEYLIVKKEEMSKLKDLRYEELKLQSYLSCENLSNREKKLAFNLRTRMVQLQCNFGNKICCQLCKYPGTEDSQRHLFEECVKIRKLCPEISELRTGAYWDIFSNDLEKNSAIVKVFDKILRKRIEFFDENF